MKTASLRRHELSLSFVSMWTLFAACNLTNVEPGIDEPLTSPENLAESVVVSDRISILFVVDNSGSMQVNQENLARNLSSSSSTSLTNACDAQGFAELRDYLRVSNAHRLGHLDAEHAEIYAQCGFIERLQLSGADFRLGLITTDMNDCDRPTANTSRGSVPQRGCLQTAPNAQDLRVLDANTLDLADKFANIIRSVGIWGSPYERDFDSAQYFLTQDHAVPASDACAINRDCSNDLQDFIGEDAENDRLAIIFVSDEDDCSNHNTIDENVPGNTALCYDAPELLGDVDAYAQFFAGLKPRRDQLRVGLLAGLDDSGDQAVAAGCKSEAEGVSLSCDPAHGNAVNTCSMCINGEPVCPCHPAIAAADCQGVAQQATNCCQADPATRLLQLSQHFPQYLERSICHSSFGESVQSLATMALSNKLLCPQKSFVGKPLAVQIQKLDGNVQELGASDWQLAENNCLHFDAAVQPRFGERVDLFSDK